MKPLPAPGTKTVHAVRWWIALAWRGYFVWFLLVSVLEATRMAARYSPLRHGQPQLAPLSHFVWLFAYWICSVVFVAACLVVPCLAARLLARSAAPCVPALADPAQRKRAAVTVTGAWWCGVCLRVVSLWFMAYAWVECVKAVSSQVQGILTVLLPESGAGPAWAFDLVRAMWYYAAREMATILVAVALWVVAPLLGRVVAGCAFTGCRCCGYGAESDVPSPCPECGDHPS